VRIAGVTLLFYSPELQILLFLPTMNKQMAADPPPDTESQNNHKFHVHSGLVHSLLWSNISLTVQDRSTKQPKDLVANVCGRIEAGKCSTTSLVEVNIVDVASRRGTGSHGTLW